MIEVNNNWALSAFRYHPFSWHSLVTAWMGTSETELDIYSSQFQSESIPLFAAAGLGTQHWGPPEQSLLWDFAVGDEIAASLTGLFVGPPKLLTVEIDSNSPRDNEIFSRGWPNQANDTVCGWGSSEPHTRRVRQALAEILDQYNVRTLNDAGCGDLAWMSMIPLEHLDYVGYDLYERANWAELRERGFQLNVFDITIQDTRPADLLICRDVFIHLPNSMVISALDRFKRSGALLLATSYVSNRTAGVEFSNFERINKPNLRHAKLDLTLPPFNLGNPLMKILEDSPGKYLGLWNISTNF